MLPKAHRLEGREEVRTVFRRGRIAYSGDISFRYLENRLSVSRFSVVVGKKVFPLAVERNRVKRLTREAIRNLLPHILPGYDGVFFYTRKPSLRLRIETVGYGVRDVLLRARILKVE